MLALARSGRYEPGAAPDLEERLLDGVLGERRVPQDLVREPVGDPAESVVELAERVLVGPRDGFDERFVGALRGPRGSSAARPAVARSPATEMADRALCGGGHLRSLPP